jgi:hypothetical protein
MPQNNVLPDWRATYPTDCQVQKPGGVTVLTNAAAPRVPNKPTYSAGTIQIAGFEAEVVPEEVETEAEAESENPGEEQEESPRRGRRKKSEE